MSLTNILINAVLILFAFTLIFLNINIVLKTLNFLNRIKQEELEKQKQESLADFDYSQIDSNNPCAYCELNDYNVCGSSIERCRAFLINHQKQE